MTHEQAIKQANYYANFAGRRWKLNSNGTSEIITEVKPIEIWKISNGWTVIVLFEPRIENHIASIKGQLLEFFIENYKKI